jgi:hypothetical protein
MTMWTLPYSAPQKIGIIFYGILVGICMVPLAGLAGLILGGVVGTVQTLLGVHGGGAWTLIGFSEMGLYLGIPAGVFVCWRVCRSRLREPNAES